MKGHSTISVAVLFAAGFAVVLSTYIRKAPARVFIGQRSSDEDVLRVNIEASDTVHELWLKPVDNIWDTNAKLITIGNDANGDTMVEESLIHQDYRVYEDVQTGAVVGIDGDKVDGILGESLAIKSEGNMHYIYHRSGEDADLRTDYLIPPNSTIEEIYASDNIRRKALSKEFLYEESIRQSSSGTPNYTVEMLVVVDSVLASKFPNVSEVLKYLKTFWSGVNTRYATISSPKFSIKLVGAVVFTSTANETFIINNLYNGNPSLLRLNALNSFGDWIVSRGSSIPVFDDAYFQTGRNLVTDTGVTNVAGVAWLGTACPQYFPGPKYATAMGEDNGNFFGIYVASHEVAHNLGSPHDSGTYCPASSSYIMTPVFSNVNLLITFSPCTIGFMSSFANATYGSCLRVQNNFNPFPIQKH